MEDSDSSLKRKRPRLDSGSCSCRSMSADCITPSKSTGESCPLHFTPPRNAATLQNSVESDLMPTLEGTPSRMTINVRDPAPSTSHLTSTAQVGQHQADRDNGKDELANSSDTEPIQNPRSLSPNILSPSSSPSQSPEIEVAEVEDINQEPGSTRWRILGSRSDPAQVRDELWDSFPCRDRAQSVLDTVNEITRHFLQRGSATIIKPPFTKQTQGQSRMVLYFEALHIGSASISRGPHLTRRSGSICTPTSTASGLTFSVLSMLCANEGRSVSACKRSTNANLSSANRTSTLLPLPLRPTDSREDHEGFEDLLASFTALTFRMVEIDCQTLHRLTADDNAKPEFVSFGYLEWLCSISTLSKSALWRNLQLTYSYDPAPVMLHTVRQICQPTIGGVNLLSQLLRQMLHHTRTVPDILDRIGVIFEILYRMIDHCYVATQESSDATSDILLFKEEILPRAYEFFQAGNDLLQTFIGKQVATLTHDLCDPVLGHLATLLLKFTTGDKDLAKRVLNEDLGILQEFSTTALPVIAEESWKFQVFQKCFLEGRMEIRIQGVESMQRQLVSIHRRFMQDKSVARQHPVVSFLCDLITNKKVIDYLVGVESHPRLIRLTGNIVGFLVVNHRYTEAESNRIWDTVVNSQNPGVVGAVLQMLPSIFNISHYASLLYLVEKLNNTPLSSWDTRMTNYAEQLLGQTITKWKETRRGFGMDKPPYQCCIRLIREALASGPSTLNKRRATSAFASHMLESLLDVGPSDQNQLDIYQACIDDIAGRTIYVTGSICVINILLRHSGSMDIGTLAHQFGLTDLVITEFEQTTNRMSQGLHDSRYFDAGLAARLDLLQHIIIYSPSSISAERGWSLWEAMVGSNALSDFAREQALVMLVNATMSLRKRNSFIDTCISEYLPKLPPRFFTSNILVFVSHVFQYGNFVEKNDYCTEASLSDRLGVDMLWRIALMAPSPTVGRKAIETLVATFVDSPKSRGVSKAAIERMHVEVVERCVRQLVMAASRLKAFNDGTSSGEDEPMVIIASDEEIHSQQLTFSRSLLILKELFHRIRSHPAYSPVPSTHSQQNDDIEEINGTPIKISYQPFSGASNRSIKTLQIGDLEKVRDLMQRFTTLTGFPQFTVIVGGQKVNLEECGDLTLRITRLHEKGLFLVKNIHNSEAAFNTTSIRGLKPLDLEIMGHFSDFYDFLSLDETLSKDVNCRKFLCTSTVGPLTQRRSWNFSKLSLPANM